MLPYSVHLLACADGDRLEDRVWRVENGADARVALAELLTAHQAVQEQLKAYFAPLLKKLLAVCPLLNGGCVALDDKHLV